MVYVDEMDGYSIFLIEKLGHRDRCPSNGRQDDALL